MTDDPSEVKSDTYIQKKRRKKNIEAKDKLNNKSLENMRNNSVAKSVTRFYIFQCGFCGTESKPK